MESEIKINLNITFNDMEEFLDFREMLKDNTGSMSRYSGIAAKVLRCIDGEDGR